MALVACLQDINSTSYCQFINTLASWFDSSFLDLNVAKTKELCLGRSWRERGTGLLLTFMTISTKGQEVEQVTYFKYLGTITDNQLTFKENVDFIYKKGRQRLALLRKMRSFNTSQRTLSMVYKSLTETVLTYNIVPWYGNLSVKQTNWHKSSIRPVRSLNKNNSHFWTYIPRQ